MPTIALHRIKARVARAKAGKPEINVPKLLKLEAMVVVVAATVALVVAATFLEFREAGAVRAEAVRAVVVRVVVVRVAEAAAEVFAPAVVAAVSHPRAAKPSATV